MKKNHKMKIHREMKSYFKKYFRKIQIEIFKVSLINLNSDVSIVKIFKIQINSNVNLKLRIQNFAYKLKFRLYASAFHLQRVGMRNSRHKKEKWKGLNVSKYFNHFKILKFKFEITSFGSSVSMAASPLSSSTNNFCATDPQRSACAWKLWTDNKTLNKT